MRALQEPPDFLNLDDIKQHAHTTQITRHIDLRNSSESQTTLSINTKILPVTTHGAATSSISNMSSLQVQERAWSRQACTFNGAPAELLTLLIAEKTDAPCTTFIIGRFALDTLDGRPPFMVGLMRAYLINRSGTQWLDHHMTVPRGSRGDMRAHCGDGDAVQEMTKILKAFYKDNGQPKMDHTELDAERVWYVEEFEIFSGWRGGQGYAQMAMGGFFKAAGKMINSSPNTFFLSPAPLFSTAEANGTPLAEMKNKDWQAIVDKLIAFYAKCGYQLWHKGRTDRRFTITLMGQEYSPPADAQEPSTALSEQAVQLINAWAQAPPPPPAVMAPVNGNANTDATDGNATNDVQPSVEAGDTE